MLGEERNLDLSRTRHLGGSVQRLGNPSKGPATRSLGHPALTQDRHVARQGVGAERRGQTAAKPAQTRAQLDTGFLPHGKNQGTAVRTLPGYRIEPASTQQHTAAHGSRRSIDATHPILFSQSKRQMWDGPLRGRGHFAAQPAAKQASANEDPETLDRPRQLRRTSHHLRASPGSSTHRTPKRRAAARRCSEGPPIKKGCLSIASTCTSWALTRRNRHTRSPPSGVT